VETVPHSTENNGLQSLRNIKELNKVLDVQYINYQNSYKAGALLFVKLEILRNVGNIY